LDDLKISDFEVGDDFTIEADDMHFTLRVAKVEPLPRAARDGGAFRLEFIGAPATILPQGTYEFKGPRRSDFIFVVPIARDEAAVRYEVIFV
jgi:hypothetical protein